jgi:F-type H+-transporting ATPase subunit alpha
LAVLLALAAGLFDSIPLDKVSDAEHALRQATTSLAAEVVDRLTSASNLSDIDRKAVLDIATISLAPFHSVAPTTPIAQVAS